MDYWNQNYKGITILVSPISRSYSPKGNKTNSTIQLIGPLMLVLSTKKYTVTLDEFFKMTKNIFDINISIKLNQIYLKNKFLCLILYSPFNLRSGQIELGSKIY
jgi:hypothetical protein